MKKELLIRILGGYVIGVMIGQFVQLCLSIGLGQGRYIFVLPEFWALFESELAAVVTQMLLTGLIGIVFALAALIFDMAKWGMLKQYTVHFFITALVWIPVVLILWTPKTMINIVSLIASFLGTYVVTWLLQYNLSKRDIEKINGVLLRGEYIDN